MSELVEAVRARGEYASLVVAALLLWRSVRPTAGLLGLAHRDVADLFWNGGVGFVVVGRLAYLLAESPRALIDPLVLIRLQGGIDPLAGAVGVAAVVAWRSRGHGAPWTWLTVGAAGLAVATVGYDLSCVLRDACYGVAAPRPFGFEMSGFGESRLATPLVEATAVLGAAAALLAVARRLPAEAPGLLLLAALALIRAALTPASVLGAEAIGLETLVLVLAGVTAIASAVAVRFVPARSAAPGG